ncbi:hypothetical protein A2642_02100 [Candidatus Nomurabacteria bacterium RIFCSPHIGHO2_01_FULL_39_10]|uniref:Peptidase A2 domain-containing protein n=1 Tax=Candidatus Nomurabacteria bacterium RIFCSPHIGHO2_01_FULL_39_10 TaxID=1801733 RepID=A0A1F6V3W9_9BACT|nr:MAG: hypothetical protein A2642_02100 [Candidatus Nomurabacteria bacterium RIFCSPHIGHO2_01_FULL_39_10]
MARIDFSSDAVVLIVDVFLEHKAVARKLRMAVDTGASCIMVPWDVALALGLAPELSSEKIEIVTASGTEVAPVVYIGLVRVGDKECFNVRAVVHDLPQKGYVDWLLGLSFLKNFNLNINFKEGVMILD